jgi:hypothetical protein
LDADIAQLCFFPKRQLFPAGFKSESYVFIIFWQLVVERASRSCITTLDIKKLTKYPVIGKLQPYVVLCIFSMAHNNPADTDGVEKARDVPGKIPVIHDYSLPARLMCAHESLSSGG